MGLEEIERSGKYLLPACPKVIQAKTNFNPSAER